MMLAGLHDFSPVGLDYSAGMDVEVAQYLQRIAWTTTQDYLNR
jgi:hypothetical protein